MDFNNELTNGFVGFCTAGAARGLYALFAQLGEGESTWDLQFSGALQSEGLFPGDVTAVDVESRSDLAFLDSLGLVSVPSPWAERVIASFFSATRSADDLSTAPWDATGRFAGGKALEERFRMLGFTEGAHQPFASVADPAEVLAWIIETHRLWDAASNLLSAAGLSFALVRNEDPRVAPKSEPWREFGGSA